MVEEVNEYLKRLSKYAKVSIIEVEEEKIKDNSSLKENEQMSFEDLFTAIAVASANDATVFIGRMNSCFHVFHLSFFRIRLIIPHSNAFCKPFFKIV